MLVPANEYPEAHVDGIHAVISNVKGLLEYESPLPWHVNYKVVTDTGERVFAK